MAQGDIMRLGAADDWFPGNFNAIDDRIAGSMAEMGFTGTVAHFQGDPTAPDALATGQRIKALLAAHGIEVVQFWGSYPSLISPDERVRAEAIRIAQGIVRLGAALEVPIACIRPTSLHPTSPWWAHPGNFTPQTRAHLVESLRQIATVAASEGVPIALECHVTTTLNTPENVRDIILETSSDWIKVNLDAVNFLTSIDEVYHSTAAINHLFDVLGPYFVTAHLKDVVVQDGHVVHISEAVPGTGVLDWDTLFRRFEALLPDGYGFIEHLKSEEQVRQANTFIRGRLAALEIPVR